MVVRVKYKDIINFGVHKFISSIPNIFNDSGNHPLMSLSETFQLKKKGKLYFSTLYSDLQNHYQNGDVLG